MVTFPLRVIDRSRVQAREDCGMLRFLNYDFENDGLDTEGGAMPLLTGIAIHAAHAKLLTGEPLERVITETLRDYVIEVEKGGIYGLDVTKHLVKEQSFLLECMLRTWAAVRLPRILEEYDVVEVEHAWQWELIPGSLHMSRRDDALLRRKDDGYAHIYDFKTLAYASELFMDSKLHDLQTNLYIQSQRERLGEPVAMIYEGLIKGKFAKETTRNCEWSGQKVQLSPYTMAWALRDDGLTIYRNTYTNKKGWKKVRMCDELPAKEWVEEWILRSPEDMVNPEELFIGVPAIEPPSYELLRVKEQVVTEELRYHRVLERYREQKELVGDVDPASVETLLTELAPRRTGRCYKYGADHKCKFLDICFNQGAEPLAEGSGYRKRVPHHDTEIVLVAA